MTMYIHRICDRVCHGVSDGICHGVSDRVGMQSLMMWGDVKHVDGVRGVGLHHGDGF